MSKNTGMSTTLSIIAVVVAAIALVIGIIAIAKNGNGPANGGFVPEEIPETDPSRISAIDSADHVRGDRNAAISIIEFSDFECPFCQAVHPTLQQIVDDYDGEVKWAYRHLPLEQIHPQATPSAIASECVAQLAGNDAFWQFIDTMFENQSQLGADFYEETAVGLGVSASAFNTCIESDATLALVGEDVTEAIEANIMGTPFMVVVRGNERIPVSGAQPYEAFVQAIEEVR